MMCLFVCFSVSFCYVLVFVCNLFVFVVACVSYVVCVVLCCVLYFVVVAIVCSTCVLFVFTKQPSLYLLTKPGGTSRHAAGGARML